MLAESILEEYIVQVAVLINAMYGESWFNTIAISHMTRIAIDDAAREAMGSDMVAIA